MNYRLVAKYLGHFIIAVAVFMIPSLLWSIYLREWGALIAFLVSMAAAVIIGGGLYAWGRKAPYQMFERETLALVGIGWLATAGIGALPYIAADVLNPIDAYFESMSGLTTTGATVLIDIEAVDKSLLWWRSFTHWLGGMGIIVLFIAVLPYLGAGGKHLFKSEAPGPDPRGLRPRIKTTASILWRIYLFFTVAQTVLLMLAGMNFYDATAHTFGTLATGGFSTYQASIAAFDSLAVEIIIIGFMIIAGTNFGLFFAMRRGNWRAPFRNTEWRIYIFVLVLSTLLVTVNLVGLQGTAPLGEEREFVESYNLPDAFRAAAFQVVSIMTTTGYGTENFDAWPHFSRALMVALMFVGGCAGSTGGGIKVVRIFMLVKMAFWKLERTFRPRTIRALRIDGEVIDPEAQSTVYAFFILHVVIFAIGTLFMSLLGLPLLTAGTAIVATLNNIGPGLEFVGSNESFAAIPQPGKVFLSFCMAMGRLELFAVCVFFMPSFWKHS